MRRGLFALRRGAVATVLVTTSALAVIASSGIDPGAAGATVAPTGAIEATSTPAVPSTGTAATAGSLTVTLSAAGALSSGATLALRLTSSSGAGHIDWENYDVAPQTVTVSTVGASGSFLDMVLGAKSANTAATIRVTEIKVSTTDTAGDIVAIPRLTDVTFTPSSATDGVVVQTPPTAPTITLVARSEPQLTAGESSGVAGTWTLTMSGDVTAGSGWSAGSIFTITVSPPSGTNCVGDDYLYFAGTPAAAVSISSGTSSTPSVSLSLSSTGSCSGSQPNELRVTFTNPVHFVTTGKTAVQIALSNVRYAVGTTTAVIGTGTVRISAGFSATPSSATLSNAPNATIVATSVSTGTPGSPATPGSTLVVKGDTPPVTVVQGASDTPVSPVHVLESASTHVPVGYVCLSLAGAEFNTTVAGAVTVSAGNGTTSAAVIYQGVSGTSASTVEFQVTKASTTAGEYTVSGLSVDAGTKIGAIAVAATFGTSPTCSEDAGSIGSATAFTVTSTPVTRVYGATPDATAVAELEHQFDAENTNCPGRVGARPVILATDAHYPDALSSAYLASSLNTGELLTPTRSLSAATIDAIRLEGITEVYIVGGPLAVSTAVAKRLEATLAYNCGGTTPLTSAGPVHIEVIRIWGATEYDTAQWVAEYPAASSVGSLDVAGAYAGSNRTGGTGEFNDTAGISSLPPGATSTLPTAIVATGRSFQDAESASVLSYAERLPILLTTTVSLSPQVSSVISNLGIKQVVVMGGPLAVSNAVVSALESLGVSVLRIAGQNATDTAVQLADFEMASKSGHLGVGWPGTGAVTVARGDYFTDGLAGAIVAAGAGRTHTHGPDPLVLCTDPTDVGPYLSAFVLEAGRTGIDGDSADRVTTLTVLGGPEAVSATVVSAMTSDL